MVGFDASLGIEPTYCGNGVDVPVDRIATPDHCDGEVPANDLCPLDGVRVILISDVLKSSSDACASPPWDFCFWMSVSDFGSDLAICPGPCILRHDDSGLHAVETLSDFVTSGLGVEIGPFHNVSQCVPPSSPRAKHEELPYIEHQRSDTKLWAKNAFLSSFRIRSNSYKYFLKIYNFVTNNSQKRSDCKTDRVNHAFVIQTNIVPNETLKKHHKRQHTHKSEQTHPYYLLHFKWIRNTAPSASFA